MSTFFSVQGASSSPLPIFTGTPPSIEEQDSLEPVLRSPSPLFSEAMPKDFFWDASPRSPLGTPLEDSLETAPAAGHWGTPPRISLEESDIGQDKVEELAQKSFFPFNERGRSIRERFQQISSGSPFKWNGKPLYEDLKQDEKAEDSEDLKQEDMDDGERKASRKRLANLAGSDLIRDIKRARRFDDSSPKPASEDLVIEQPGTPIKMPSAILPGTPIGTPNADEGAEQPLFVTPSPITVRKRPPPMPKRLDSLFQSKSKAYEKAMNYYLAGARGLRRALQKDYPDFNISVGRSLGEGHFSLVYLLDWNKNVSQISDEKAEEIQQVIKIPNFQEEPTEGAFILNRAREIQNYFQLKKVGFPVSVYYNLDEIFGPLNILDLNLTELKESVKNHFDGFYRSVYVPQGFLTYEQLAELNQKMSAMNGEELRIFKKLLKKENHPIYQVRQMFRLAYQHQIPVDLKQDNVRIVYPDKTSSRLSPEEKSSFENGQVLLCDLFYEEKEEQNPLDYLASQKLLTFAPEGSVLWKYLDPRPLT